MVKIKCEVCEKAEAEVLCCADEAVLCRKCDEKVHAANKLSSRHQRLSLLKLTSSSSLSSSAASNLPLCDICKQRSGSFFCLEDRALFCKNCDQSTHTAATASPLLLYHQRFLIAGMKVSGDSMMDATSSSSSSNFRRQGEATDASLMLNVSVGSGGVAGLEPSWPLDEIFGTEDFNYTDFSNMKSSS